MGMRLSGDMWLVRQFGYAAAGKYEPNLRNFRTALPPVAMASSRNRRGPALCRDPHGCSALTSSMWPSFARIWFARLVVRAHAQSAPRCGNSLSDCSAIWKLHRIVIEVENAGPFMNSTPRQQAVCDRSSSRIGVNRL